MKTITYEEFLDFDPCYLDDPKEKALMDSIAQRQDRWTALDILELEEIPDDDKFWAVLREELIEPEKLHEFACVCAERALSRVENPDPRSVAAIEAKRAWMKGEISDAELAAASAAAWVAAREHALYSSSAVLRAGALAAHGVAYRNDADYIAAECANMAIWAALEAAGEHSEGFAGDSDRYAAMDAACFAEQAWQVEELKKMLREAEA